MNSNPQALSPEITAVLFDLDGVLTPTAQVHEEAWRRLFSSYFEERGVAPYTDADYFEHLDGRARYDAVQSILASRGIEIPYGHPEDTPDTETVCGLGNRKNREFNEAVRTTGVAAYPGSKRFLDFIERHGPLQVAVVSSSKNAPPVLKAAGLLDHFPVIVDGNVAAEHQIPGKPAPDTYLYAARELGVEPENCAVVEDAVSGVQAGRAGDFGMVIGVDRGAGEEALLNGGASFVVDDLDALVPADFESTPGARIPPRFPAEMDPDWTVSAEDLLATDLDARGSVFAIANGYLGLRGDVGVKITDAKRGTFLNGLHETWPIAHAEDAYGFARIGQSMVTLPDATGFQILVDSEDITEVGTWLEPPSRVLDLHAGVLRQRMEWISPNGKAVRIEQRAAVSLSDPHLAVIEVAVTALDRDCDVKVRSTVELPARPPVVVSDGILLELDDPRKANKLIDGAVVETDAFPTPGGASITYQTRASRMAAALAVSNRAEVLPAAEAGADSPVPAVMMGAVPPNEEESQAWKVEANLQRGTTLLVTKTLAYARDDLFEERPGDPVPAADAALAAEVAVGAEDFFDRQAHRSAELWSVGDVNIELGETPATRPGAITDELAHGNMSLQSAIRWCLFQIMQASACLVGTGVPAKGLTGSGYDGHYFWDAEIYVLPYLVYANPDAARHLLNYRFLTLDAARVRAAEMHEDGALFPWRTIAGAESSAYYPAGTAQYHIDAAIAYAINQYLNASNDISYLISEGIDILVETARMWMSLGFLNGWDDKFHIHGVTGPDEYTAVVNDNLYTNVMARANLRTATRWLQYLHTELPEEYEVVIRRLAVSGEEIARMNEAADKMFVPWNEPLGLHPQDEAFLEKQMWDFENTPPENYPLLLHYHPLVIYRHQVLKQSDTVLALYLLASEFTDAEKRANFEYYDAITTGDSSLSAAAQSIVAAEVGDGGLAAEYFGRLLGVDLADLHYNTYAGLHMASLGGTWSALVMGFAGLRDDTGTLHFSPRLPINWTGMRFTLMRHGRPLRVHVARAGITFLYEAEPEEVLTVTVGAEGRETITSVDLHGQDETWVPYPNE